MGALPSFGRESSLKNLSGASACSIRTSKHDHQEYSCGQQRAIEIVFARFVQSVVQDAEAQGWPDQPVQKLPARSESAHAESIGGEGQRREKCERPEPHGHERSSESVMQEVTQHESMLEDPEREEMNARVKKCKEAHHSAKNQNGRHEPSR